MNMEVNGSTQAPQEVSISIPGEKHENEIDRMTSDLKYNGSNSDDLLKITFELQAESDEKQNSTKNSVVPNNTSQDINNESSDSPLVETAIKTINPLENKIDSVNSSMELIDIDALGIDEITENIYEFIDSEQRKLDGTDFIDSALEQSAESMNTLPNDSSECINDELIDSPPEQKLSEAGDPLASNDNSEIFNKESIESPSNVLCSTKEVESIDINESSENINIEQNESSVQQKKVVQSDPLEIDTVNNVKNLSTISDEAPAENEKVVPVVTSKTQQKKVVEPKPIEKMQLRRSSRGIKRKRYDDEGPDFEEVKSVSKIRNTNKQSMQKFYSNSPANIPNLYQRVLGPNTTLTPISAKSRTANVKNAHSTPQPAILPSLTDDMFVVEAPSFIVPYVYEKPPLEPLKEFVENLGKQIEEDKVKLEKLTKEQNNEPTDKANGKRTEDNDEDVKSMTNLEEMIYGDSDSKKSKRDKKSKHIRDDDDKSWAGESSSDSTEEIDEKEEMNSTLAKSKINKLPYFDLTLGKFFTEIGLNLVTQFVQNDLLKQQKKKLLKDRRAGHTSRSIEASIVALKKNIALSEQKNEPFLLEHQRKCPRCPFKSESMLVLAQHLETPHMINNLYKCNYCKFEIRNMHDILYHMENEHNIQTKLEKAPPHNSCPNCPYEDHGKGKLTRHQIACAKRFKPDLNLAPPFEWEPPAKILTGRAKTTLINPYQYNINRHQMVNNNIGKPIVSNIYPGANNMRVRLRGPVPIPRVNVVSGISILRGGATIRPSISSTAMMQPNVPGGSKSKLPHTPSISITPLPKAMQIHQQVIAQQNKNACVICEICDGYIKDLEQLRSHMQWIHRVKIHPKMMTNQPPLNCQKCQLRFFTDQGLERHLLGSHGLVTKSMQEEANKGIDGGRCPICGRIYQLKLLDHVGRDHKMTLKPAHLSYKCTVCSAVFGLYKQFENHVYSAHSVVAKRVMNKGKSLSQSKVGNTILKPLQDRDDLTITTTSSKNFVSVDEDK